MHFKLTQSDCSFVKLSFMKPKINITSLSDNPDFLSWLADPSKSSTNWNNELKGNPELLAKANLMRESMKFNSHVLNLDTRTSLLENIHEELQLENNTAPLTAFKPSHKILLRIAASLIILVAAFFLLRNNSVNIQHSTSIGELVDITLPDGSEVKLNANSHIWSAEDWKDDEKRQIHQEGYVHYDIIETAPLFGNETFEVVTKRAIVEVIGTKFSINELENQTIISLIEGGIKVFVGDNVEYMAPGKIMKVNEDGTYVIEDFDNISDSALTAWTKDIIRFDGTSLDEFETLIEQKFGFDVQLPVSLSSRGGFTATFVDDNTSLATILDNFSTTYNIQHSISGNNIVFNYIEK